MNDPKIKRILRSIPRVFNAGSNPVINALLQGFAGADDTISEQIANTKAQLFVRTATGTYLDNLGNSLGVSRPESLGLSDEQYQELIPNLSLKAKQIRKAFYDTAQVFFGPLFIFTNIQTTTFAPFNVSVGDTIIVQIDQLRQQTVTVRAGEVASPGFATSQEMLNIFSKIKNTTASIVTDVVTEHEFLNLAVTTPGPSGSLTIVGGTMIDPSKIDFQLGRHRLIEQDQRVAVYEVRPNELIIELPAIVPALRRTLKGSHHWHADATIASPVAPQNGIWQGSFLFDPEGATQEFTISSQAATTQETLNKGDVYLKVTVDSTSNVTESSGFLIFGFGTSAQEEPIRFRGVPNSKTILLDPGYVFKHNQPSGTRVNVIYQRSPYVPRTDGTDLAIYLTSPSNARVVVQNILASLAAAGVIVTFIILAPTYEYLIQNPYLEEV